MKGDNQAEQMNEQNTILMKLHSNSFKNCIYLLHLITLHYKIILIFRCFIQIL